MVSGVVLSLTSVLLMCFYIKQFVIDHKKEQLGILKALGYSNGQLAKRFWAFKGSVLELERFLAISFISHDGTFYDFRNEKGFARNYYSPSLATLASFGDPANDLLYASRDWLCWRQLQTPALRLLKSPQVNQGQKEKTSF